MIVSIWKSFKGQKAFVTTESDISFFFIAFKVLARSLKMSNMNA